MDFSLKIVAVHFTCTSLSTPHKQLFCEGYQKWSQTSIYASYEDITNYESIQNLVLNLVP